MLTLTNPQIAVAVVVVALITFACRIAPFALLRGRSTSPLLGFLSSAMPLGVMVVLVAYTLGDVGTTPAAWLPAGGGGPQSRRRRACTCGAARSACR
jgi:predicted branched-chain amino acid permease